MEGRMIPNRTGFIATNNTVYIDKDVEARLIYTLDWSEWLDSNDSLATVSFEAAARRNDPTPLIVHSSGIEGNKTYVEISGGQTDKSYTVTAGITTTNGLEDRRSFRVNVLERSL